MRTSCSCAVCSASSARLRWVRSSTKAIALVRVSSNAALPTSTGTRLPSLRKNSFSKTSHLPTRGRCSTARRLTALQSAGVRSSQRIRPDERSSRSYPSIFRKASLASSMRPSRSQIATPTMFESTRRRILPSRSWSSLVETAVLQRGRGLGGEQLQHCDLVGREHTWSQVVLEVEQGDYLALLDERQAEYGTSGRGTEVLVVRKRIRTPGVAENHDLVGMHHVVDDRCRQRRRFDRSPRPIHDDVVAGGCGLRLQLEARHRAPQ